MIAIQHWKVYPIHYGTKESNLSQSFMKKMTWQHCHEQFGTPILESTLKKCHRMFKLLSIFVQDATYPIFYDDMSDMDYNKARFVLVLMSKNTTTMREFDSEFSLCTLCDSVE
jgi:hypothetical protein